MLGSECELQHAFVICIGLALGLKGGRGPTPLRGNDPLHLHIGPLDDSQSQWRSAPRDALHGPLAQTLLGVKGVRNIGLQRNARVCLGKSLAVERGHEGFRCDPEIAVLFHIEVDEFLYSFSVGSNEALL